ncbi:MAG: hypothetical protein A3I16_17215 [Burkholderiales bacterium RIFCSPLOWO2_02_FULL_66_35]|nr:MAG: hypothetical protein A3I16_17215 [Burkholderiales bacterium RIFCSPLOWO2_02_FULL_66_35]
MGGSLSQFLQCLQHSLMIVRTISSYFSSNQIDLVSRQWSATKIEVREFWFMHVQHPQKLHCSQFSQQWVSSSQTSFDLVSMDTNMQVKSPISFVDWQ